MRNPRICADCRHCTLQRQLFILQVEKCSHPRAVDVVTGKAVWDARQLRDPGSRLCGAAGRLWEAQEATSAPTPATPVAPDPVNAALGDPVRLVWPFAKGIRESRR